MGLGRSEPYSACAVGIAICGPVAFPCKDTARGCITAGGVCSQHGGVKACTYSVGTGCAVCKGSSLRKLENWEAGGSQVEQRDKLKEIWYQN